MFLKELTGRNTILGLPDTVFFTPTPSDVFRSFRYGQLLETPLGVAAGPHTQMAQNLVAAWLCGARYLELKTVQTLDTIEVTKPCIDAEDEGYNCEWSQELTLAQSEEEYLKALVLIHALKHRLEHDNGTRDSGVLFNISVGYNLEGILKPNVQHFLEAMTAPNPRIAQLVAELAAVAPDTDLSGVPDTLTNHITISTMHGCPPDEIESIADYFITTRKLHTTIKLNPTLLGPVALRTILNDELGFSVEVPDIAFEHDLKWEDAVGLLSRMQRKAVEAGVAFGVKLTNTLESRNIRKVLPEKEPMHYMSGRALHPVSLELAHRLAEHFQGKLDITFCAGLDAENTPGVLMAGLTPVTFCTELLKPGGYARLAQVLDLVKDAFTANGFAIPETGRIGGPGGDRSALFGHLRELSSETRKNPKYQKSSHPWAEIKGSRELEAFDCIKAPCVENCPTSQKIPLYLGLASEKRFSDALQVIFEDNPLPLATGMACDHKCQERCTRINYDSPVLIREIKRASAIHGQYDTPAPAAQSGFSTAIIGAGPAGLSCAWTLANAGVKVTLFDRHPDPGGLLVRALPAFRLDHGKIGEDFLRIMQRDVTWQQEEIATPERFMELCDRFDAVFIGVGASSSRPLHIEGEDLQGVVPFLEFLDGVNAGRVTSIGHRTVVIGGGNSAMDVARAAHRLRKPGDTVTVLYRRTKSEMPADREELADLLAEGVEIRELVAPVRAMGTDGKLESLLCTRMVLAEPDSSGRRRPVPEPGGEFVLPVDMLLSAVGQDPQLDFLEGTPVVRSRWGTIATTAGAFATGHDKVYAGGDAVRGPMSIIAAIADGKLAAREICAKAGLEIPRTKLPKAVFGSRNELLRHRARIQRAEPLQHLPLSERDNFRLITSVLSEDAAAREASRCLACHRFCDVCVSVCPNRANISYTTRKFEWQVPTAIRDGGEIRFESPIPFAVTQEFQVANIKDFCNECGNCVTFCPSAGRPFADKPRLALSRESFDAEPETCCLESSGPYHTLHFHSPEGDGKLTASHKETSFRFVWGANSGDIAWHDFSVRFHEMSTDTLDFSGIAPLAVLLHAHLQGTLCTD